MATAHDPEETITDRDLRRVMDARRALHRNAPYDPPPRERRRRLGALGDGRARASGRTSRGPLGRATNGVPDREP